MSIVVTDEGFRPDSSPAPVPLEEAQATDEAVILPSDTDPAVIPTLVARRPLRLIAIEFPSSADGRGFTLAALIRRAGWQGVLRASGHVLADQYAMARRSGFDEVAISAELAARQPEEHWKNRAAWQAHHYQARLRG